MSETKTIQIKTTKNTNVTLSDISADIKYPTLELAYNKVDDNFRVILEHINKYNDLIDQIIKGIEEIKGDDSIIDIESLKNEISSSLDNCKIQTN